MFGQGWVDILNLDETKDTQLDHIGRLLLGNEVSQHLHELLGRFGRSLADLGHDQHALEERLDNLHVVAVWLKDLGELGQGKVGRG